MCVIAVKIKGVNLNTSDIVDMFEANQDGVGLSYKRLDGKFIIDKFIPKTSDELIQYIHKHHECIYNKNIEVVLHFRIATSGKVDAATCHPYRINDDAVLYHNGIVNNFLNNKELAMLTTKSDTQIFAINHVSNFKSYNELWQYTEYNKFVVHHIDGKIELYGNFVLHNNLMVSNKNFINVYKASSFRYYTKSMNNTVELLDEPNEVYHYIDNETMYLDLDYHQILRELYKEHSKEYELVKKTGAITTFSEYIVTKYSLYGDDITSILDAIYNNNLI